MVTLARLSPVGSLGLVALSSLAGLLAAPMHPVDDKGLDSIFHLAAEGLLEMAQYEHGWPHDGPPSHGPNPHSALGNGGAALPPTASLQHGQGWFDHRVEQRGTPDGMDPHASYSAYPDSSRPSFQPVSAGSVAGWQGTALDPRGVSSSTYEPSHAGQQASLVDADLWQVKRKRIASEAGQDHYYSGQVEPDVGQKGPSTASTSPAGHNLQPSQPLIPRRRRGRPRQTKFLSDPLSDQQSRTPEELLVAAKEQVQQQRDLADREALYRFNFPSYEALQAYLSRLNKHQIRQLGHWVFSKAETDSQAKMYYSHNRGVSEPKWLSMVFSTNVQRAVYLANLESLLQEELGWEKGTVTIDPMVAEIKSASFFRERSKVQKELELAGWSRVSHPLLPKSAANLELGPYRFWIAPHPYGSHPKYGQRHVIAFPKTSGDGLPAINMGYLVLPRNLEYSATRRKSAARKQRAGSMPVQRADAIRRGSNPTPDDSQR